MRTTSKTQFDTMIVARGLTIQAIVCVVSIGLLRALAGPPVVTVVQQVPIVLSWPTNLPSFALQTTTNLSTNAAWQNWVATPAVSGTNYILTNGFTEPSRFFRASNWPQVACVQNLKYIGVAIFTWAEDNDYKFPFQLSTNYGGTMELREIGPDGFDTNSYLHFQVLSNYLGQTGLLVCPGDFGRSPASSFQTLGPENVTYRLRTGDAVTLNDPSQVLAVCPVDENTLFVSGMITTE